ncbi:MAG: hypothetical protein KGI80_02645 [Verrucomicrobiota bacterium]|nr:hypothetical protein [Verrucomicrobiota bacterium]
MTIPETPPPDKSPDRIAEAKPLEPDFLQAKEEKAGGGFQSFMEQGPTAPTGTAPSPMTLSKPGVASTPPTMESLQTQAESLYKGLGVVENQLTTLRGLPLHPLKRSQATLLKNKLEDVRDTSKNIAGKLGVETPSPKVEIGEDEPDGGVLTRFLSYIGDGQNQLLAVQKKIEEMGKQNGTINPADMIAIQVKMGIAQQEIEYSSMLLGKVMSSITTVMNIQL